MPFGVSDLSGGGPAGELDPLGNEVAAPLPPTQRRFSVVPGGITPTGSGSASRLPPAGGIGPAPGSGVIAPPRRTLPPVPVPLASGSTVRRNANPLMTPPPVSAPQNGVSAIARGGGRGPRRPGAPPMPRTPNAPIPGGAGTRPQGPTVPLPGPTNPTLGGGVSALGRHGGGGWFGGRPGQGNPGFHPDPGRAPRPGVDYDPAGGGGPGTGFWDYFLDEILGRRRSAG